MEATTYRELEAERDQLAMERDEFRRRLDTLIDAACLDGAGHRLRSAIERLQEQGLPATELQQLRETARLAERFARAKGRHHSQHAMCDLLEHFGMPCTRPGEEPEKLEPEKLEPEAWMYQHEETGQIGFIDQWQVENRFEENNPRLQLICPLYRHPPG